MWRGAKAVALTAPSATAVIRRRQGLCHLSGVANAQAAAEEVVGRQKAHGATQVFRGPIEAVVGCEPTEPAAVEIAAEDGAGRLLDFTQQGPELRAPSARQKLQRGRQMQTAHVDRPRRREHGHRGGGAQRPVEQAVVGQDHLPIARDRPA